MRGLHFGVVLVKRRALLAFVAVACGPAHAASLFVAPVPPPTEEDAPAAKALTSAVETAVLKKVVEADVVTPSALDTKLEIDLVTACRGDGDDAACVVDFAQGMGVDYVVRTTLARLGHTRILTIAVYDGHRAALLGQAQRKAERAEDLVDAVPDAVVEAAKAAELRVVVERVKAPPYLAYGALAGGAVVLAGSLAAHAVALGVFEADYEKAAYTRDQARGWELARPFAYGLPVAGYLAGAGLVVVGIVALSSEGP